MFIHFKRHFTKDDPYKDMIGENGYSCLKEYKALTNLRIVGNNWIDHVNECLVLLERLPQLLKLKIAYVVGGGLRGHGLPKGEGYYALQSNEEDNIFIHNKLKKITCKHHYAAPNDKELLTLMKSFPSLSELGLEIVEATSWKTKIQPSALHSFFAHMFQQLTKFDCIILRNENSLRFLEQYYQSIK